MKSYRRELTLTLPQRRQFVNITPQVEAALEESGIREGLLLCNAMHITASVFINDDEPGLHADFETWLEKLAPEFAGYTLLCSHNAPVMEGAALAEMAEAFSAVERGGVSGYEYMRHRRYDFDGFSIVM